MRRRCDICTMSRQMVHGDVKPDNTNGRDVLLDLGHAISCKRRRCGPYGTHEYMAPEVLAGGTVTKASDMYSMGKTLLHVIAKLLNVPSYRLLVDAPEDLASLQEELEEAVWLVFLNARRMIQANPDHRPSAAEALAEMQNVPSPEQSD
eukprot:TRINITY_DN2218_c0_g1_i4.p1 TRINITY_DN2218_c0_g1~~TRINITY_DN2218_c0_g1_i4.p1  ORF type:complete len:149 (-),score=28.24 TRINITY_DN2218_c0_g1_i4:98-544(-)